MPHDAHDRSYDDVPDIGLLYDAVPLYGARSDVAFYVDEARRARGPVLEIGCGTGRVLLPVARATEQAIVGLDGSARMLERCRAKLDTEPESVRRRVTLHEGDVRDFALGRTFSLVTAPFRIMQHVVTIDDQLRCLAAVARHLEPGGRLVFDVFNPSFAAMLQDRSAEAEDTPELTLADGRRFRRAARVPRVRWVEQVSEVEIIWYVADAPGAPSTRYVQAFDMRWYLPAELTHLLARAGFRVEAIYGNYDRSPLTDGSPDQVVCAVKT